MPRLFVDVDGTLAFGEKTNWPLVDVIRSFLDEHDDFDLVVWSHAGTQHADEWARKCFDSAGYPAEVMAKDFTEYDPDEDLLIDNMKLPFGLLPSQFVRQMHDDTLEMPEDKSPLQAVGRSELEHWTEVMNGVPQTA